MTLPGRARLATNPCSGEEMASVMTIGMVEVARLAATIAGSKLATITSTRSVPFRGQPGKRVELAVGPAGP